MGDDFADVMRALWSHLDLGTYRPGPGGRARLTVEGRSVAIEATPDGGQVRATVDLGGLAPDPVRAEAQLHSLLRRSCSLVLLRTAALTLGTGPGGADLVRTEALAPCRVAAISGVVQAIENALFLAEACETLFSDRRAADTGRLGPASPDDLADALIFRP